MNEIERARIIHDGQESLSKIAKGSELTLGHRCRLARAAAGAEDGPDWPGTLKGRHRQVVDAYTANDGFPLAFAFTFVATNGPASAGVVPATAVVVLRHTAFPLALDHMMWQKYKIGQSLSILDPETKAPALTPRQQRPNRSRP